MLANYYWSCFQWEWKLSVYEAFQFITSIINILKKEIRKPKYCMTMCWERPSKCLKSSTQTFPWREMSTCHFLVSRKYIYREREILNVGYFRWATWLIVISLCSHRNLLVTSTFFHNYSSTRQHDFQTTTESFLMISATFFINIFIVFRSVSKTVSNWLGC